MASKAQKRNRWKHKNARSKKPWRSHIDFTPARQWIGGGYYRHQEMRPKKRTLYSTLRELAGH